MEEEIGNGAYPVPVQKVQLCFSTKIECWLFLTNQCTLNILYGSCDLEIIEENLRHSPK